MAGPRRLNGALLLAVLLLTPACAAIVAGDGFDAEDRLVRATPSSSSGRVPSSKRPPSFEFSDLPARSLRRTPSQDSAFTGTAEQSDDHLDASRAEDELDASRDEDEPVSSESDAHFEKTLAAQIEKALDKEFDRADEEQSGVLGEGAGRSFNETKAAGQLETVVRVSRTGGGVVHEVVERDGDLGGGFRDGRGNATGAEDRRSESLFERLESSAKNIDRALGGKEVDEDVERLVDSRDNEFVISNPKSGTMELQQDLRLISDLVIILVASAAGAMVFTLMGQPLITGYLIAGSLVGPGGFGLVVELVQVETLAQFGIIFLLFALGVEFSFAQLRHVQSVAVFGGSMQIALMMLVCGVISDFTGAPSKEGVFVGAFLSMSSTAVVIKCLAERGAAQTTHGQITIGTLILQDCTVGLLFALLPVLGGTNGVGEGVVAMLRVGVLMCAFFAAAVGLSKSLVGRLFRAVSARGVEPELYQMVAIAFCLVVAWSSEKLGLSIELGAFVAGVMVSATPFAEQTLKHVEPVRNVFAALFVASIGMIMNPFFLWVHLDVLVATLFVVIAFKCSLITLVVRSFGYSTRTSFTVGVSLAQVGEFSFVLLSRASNLGLVQRKLYLLLLGTTALSLVVTPVMFRCTPYLLRFAFLARWIKREEEDAVELQGRGPPASPKV